MVALSHIAYMLHDCTLQYLLPLFLIAEVVGALHIVMMFLTPLYCLAFLGLISETKTPIVNIFFLNEWGDYQVVPYRPKSSLRVGEKRELMNSPQLGRRTPKSSSPNAPLHYAIIVDELKLRVRLVNMQHAAVWCCSIS